MFEYTLYLNLSDKTIFVFFFKNKKELNVLIFF